MNETPDIRALPFTLPALAAAYASGLSQEAVARETLRRVGAADDPAMFISLAEPEALAEAARALGPFDPARPLWGVPVAVKDNIDVAGFETTAACPRFAYTPERDAECVARLRAAGALVVGKTNLDQLATGLVGVRSPYGVPRNSLDPEIVPGGSSSGSGVAVARGCVALALGTDTAGSGRVPAALNNVVGLKPSLGTISTRGVVPACRTLDVVSIFALTVADARAAFAALAAQDLADPFSRPRHRPTPASPPPPWLRVGVPDTASLSGDDPGQRRMFVAASERLAAEGYALVEVDFTPFFEIARLLYDGPWVAERHTVLGELLAAEPEAVDPAVAAIVCRAEGMSAADVFRGLYRLSELRRAVAPVLARVDLLCVPSIPGFPSVVELRADPIGPNARLGRWTNFVNLLGLCGLAVPTPADGGEGRPGGVTLLGPSGADGRLADLGAVIEQWGERTLGATGWARPAPPEPQTEPFSGEVAIVVCGAHMAGLPLNGELTRRGGRFLRAARTAPIYGLHVLPGGPPARPGLVRRTVEARGLGVEVEVWALPAAELGPFAEGIPSPLGLGRVLLEDGASPLGFLCEAWATEGARDVTALGGWRRTLEEGAA